MDYQRPLGDGMSIHTATFAAFCAAALLGPLYFGGLAGGSAYSAPADAAASARSNEVPVAIDARLGGDETQTRLVIDLSHKINLSVFTLANPFRVIIDMPQVAFQLPAKTGETGRGLIKAFRYGLVMQGGSRMVIDLARPSRVDKAIVLDRANGQPARLVLELTAVDREAFLRSAALERRKSEPSRPRKEPEADVRSGGDPRPLIVIDPGHGGPDNGTRLAPADNPEKAIVLAFGQTLRDKLEKTGKYRAALTRSDDTFVALADRVNLARARHAALFVSIHADASARQNGRADSEAQGATIYTLSETASDAAAARLAEDENHSDVIGGLDLSTEPNDVADILLDLARRETKTYSVQFARSLANEMRAVTRLHKEPVKSAGFRVLRAPDIPSVLIELGYVTNVQDVKSLTSDAWRGRMADAMVRSIDTFFTTRMAGSGQRSGRN